VLSEANSAINKIENGQYDFKTMDFIRRKFENLRISAKMDPPFRAVYSFVDNWIACFKSKHKSSIKVMTKAASEKKENLNKSQSRIKPTHKYTRSKGQNIMKLTKREEQLMSHQYNR